MLHELRIRDLGVIEDAVVEFGPGLTVVTGETGAGKTMVVTALGLLLGERADSALVRHGAQRATVEGVLELTAGHPALDRAAEAGADTEDGLILIRSVSSEGRSRAHVGGRSAPVGLLTELGEHLVAVHGQADQWRLRQPDEHRELLDNAGGASLAAALTAYRTAFSAHQETERELAELTEQATERVHELDRLQTGLELIEAIDPQPSEDEQLRVEDERLSHAEELRAAAGNAHDLVTGGADESALADEGILGGIARARHALAAVSSNDPDLAALAERLIELGHLAAEVGADLGAYLADLEVEPGRLAWVQERRAQLAGLTRRYGSTIDDVLQWGQEAARRHSELSGADERIADLQARLAGLTTERDAAADALTAARVDTAGELAARITSELSALAMGNAEVVVEVTPSQKYGPTGADTVLIGLAANSGAPPRSVTKAASGGELSRVMLAIEVATTGATTSVPTFVFDEVDAGVGGRAALDVGNRLAALARHAQVIVVTHLAQVAAYADRHLVVSKADDGQVTRSGVRLASGEERIAELARMMAGTDSPAARSHARDLLAAVAEVTGRA